jgi:hypothetical protein
MLSPLDRAGFTRLALRTVGRETLVASMREIGASSSSTLAGRYGIYVEVILDENGNPESGHAATNSGIATTVGIALIRTGNPYAVAAGVVLILGGAVIDESCRRKWDQQRERVLEAARILPSKLIREDEQWALVEEAERVEVARFADHGHKAEAAIDALASRWKTLFEANAARAGAADAVLTVAKVEQIRRDLERGLDPAEIRRQVAVAEVAADIGRVNDAVARGRIPVITSCLSVAGKAAEEDQLDGVRFARAQFKALRAQGGFAPLHPLLDQSDAYAAAAEREVGLSGPTATGRVCSGGGGQAATSQGAHELVNAHRPAANNGLASLARRLTLPKAGLHLDLKSYPFPVGSAQLQNLHSVPRASVAAIAATPELSFCITVRRAQSYSCGGAGTGVPYGGGFADTGNPRNDTHSGANDGSFARDNRRLSEKIEEASQNINSRIQTTRTRVDEARQAMPSWTATNTAVLGSMTVRTSQADAADARHEMAFRTATAPLLTRVAADLDAFRSGAADPAAVAALVRSVGGADMSLPDLPRMVLPATVPAIIGVTALDAGFGAGTNPAERAIQRERWKAEDTLASAPEALRLSRELLAQAEFVAAFGPGAGNRVMDELIRDSASLRFAADGGLGGTIAVVGTDGTISRVVLTDPRQLPANALLNMVRNFRYDQDFFRTGAVQLDGELAGGASFAGRRAEVLSSARDMYDRASAIFRGGDVAEARAWLTMAIGALDIATRFIPGVDWGRDVYEAVTGRDLFTGIELDTFDRVSAVIGVISAGVGNDVLQIRSAVRRIEDLPADKLDELYEFAQTVDRTTEQGLRYDVHAIDQMNARNITREEILEVLDNHTPLWSTRHSSYTAVGHVSTRPERIAVAVRVDEAEIRTVIVEQLDDVPFEKLRYKDGPHKGKLQYEPLKLDD